MKKKNDLKKLFPCPFEHQYNWVWPTKKVQPKKTQMFKMMA
jgi:hypothetical protein